MRTEDELRAALRALERHAPALDAVLPEAVTARRPRRPRWLRLGVPVLAALAVTAAVVTPLSVRDIIHDQLPNGPGTSTQPSLTAQQVLAQAARAAAAQPAQAGKYWRVSIASLKLIAGGPNAHPYALAETLSPWVTWYPANPDTAGNGTVAYSDSRYTTAPATAGAAAQWRADGSPALPSGTLPAARTEAFDFLHWIGQGGGKTHGLAATPAEIRSLPADPIKLKALIEQEVGESELPGPYSQSRLIFSDLTDLLSHEPITPQVRAAVFQVMATLPGLEMTGRMTDPIGRAGYGFTINGAYPNWGPQGVVSLGLTLVISPATGTLLAEESLGTQANSSHPPASGAVPGQTACSQRGPMITVSGSTAHQVVPRPYTFNGLTYCVPQGATVHIGSGGDGTYDQVLWRTPHEVGSSGSPPLGPQVEVPVGTLTGAYVVLSEGWTNASPAPGA